MYPKYLHPSSFLSIQDHLQLVLEADPGLAGGGAPGEEAEDDGDDGLRVQAVPHELQVLIEEGRVGRQGHLIRDSKQEAL